MVGIANTYQILKTYIYRKQRKYRVKCLGCGKFYTLTEEQLYVPCECVVPDGTVGNMYGSLFVYSKYSEDNKTYCKCVCQICGNLTTVLRDNLVRGHTKSCGCLKEKNLEGQTFGKLTVGKRIRQNGKTYYYCLCGVCGRTVLKRHETIPIATSCGCDKKEVRADALREKAFVDGTQPSKIKLDKPPTKANKSGFVGVCWDKSRGKWKADIRFRGKKYNLGRFEDINDAIEARKEAERKIFGDFLVWYNEYKKKEE